MFRSPKFIPWVHEVPSFAYTCEYFLWMSPSKILITILQNYRIVVDLCMARTSYNTAFTKLAMMQVI
jgi:hypothetical protein